MLSKESEGLRARWLLVIMALPIVVFYAAVFGLVLNLPLYDDYDAGLDFAGKLLALPVGTARLLYFAAAQHNEYKLYFGQAFVCAELAVLGHIDFRLLSVAGDLFVLLLLWVLWKLFLPGEQDYGRRLMLFVPVPFLVFQLQYWETLNWPLAGLQTLPVLGFALGSIYLLGRRTNAAWWGAAAAMLLAIAASGNGFLLLPLGLLMLLLSRRWIGCAGWVMVGAAALWVYAYRYTRVLAGAGQQSVPSALLHLKVMYVVAFLGSAGAFPVPALAYATGLALCGFGVWMVARGYPRRNPVVAYCVLFVLLTALGVAGIRSDGGLLQSVSSRYRMYSDLLLVFVWFAVVEEFPVRLNVKSPVYRAAVVCSVVFWMANVAFGVRGLHMRNSWMKHGIVLYEHPELRTGPDGPIYLQPRNEDAGWVRFELHARRELEEAAAKGIYSPPVF